MKGENNAFFSSRWFDVQCYLNEILSSLNYQQEFGLHPALRQHTRELFYE